MKKDLLGFIGHIEDSIGVDLELVWEVVERDIPILKKELQKTKR